MFGSQRHKLRRVEILILRTKWIYLSNEFFLCIFVYFLHIQLSKMLLFQLSVGVTHHFQSNPLARHNYGHFSLAFIIKIPTQPIRSVVG